MHPPTPRRGEIDPATQLLCSDSSLHYGEDKVHQIAKSHPSTWLYFEAWGYRFYPAFQFDPVTGRTHGIVVEINRLLIDRYQLDRLEVDLWWHEAVVRDRPAPHHLITGPHMDHDQLRRLARDHGEKHAALPHSPHRP